jgi:hypothetical protein
LHPLHFSESITTGKNALSPGKTSAVFFFISIFPLYQPQIAQIFTDYSFFNQRNPRNQRLIL